MKKYEKVEREMKKIEKVKREMKNAKRVEREMKNAKRVEREMKNAKRVEREMKNAKRVEKEIKGWKMWFKSIELTINLRLWRETVLAPRSSTSFHFIRKAKCGIVFWTFMLIGPDMPPNCLLMKYGSGASTTAFYW